MKNKLKKDLKFLRTWKGKLPTSLALALLSSVMVDTFVGLRGDGDKFFILTTPVYYIILYFFNAWLVGDEEDSDKEET